MEFLIEFLQGPCIENQIVLTKTNIIEFIKDLLAMFIEESNYEERGFTTSNDREMINNFVTKSTKVLASLIEGNPDLNIIHSLIERLDFSFIKSKLTEEFENFVKKKLKLPINSSLEVINEVMFQSCRKKDIEVFFHFKILKI